METTQAATLPEDHIKALQRIEAGYWWYSARVHWATELVEKWLPDQASPKYVKYVDLGCGTGGFAREIAHRFNFENVTLVDNDPSMIKDLSGFRNYKILQRDLSKGFELPDKANLITCMDVLEHIENDQFFLEEVFSNLHAGGILILTVPAHQALFSQWDKNLGHFRRYSRGLLRKRLKRAGFVLGQTRYMWTPLAPIGYLRKFKSFKKDENAMDFPKVSPWLNELLIRYSKIENRISKWLPMPFGTSLIMFAKRL